MLIAEAPPIDPKAAFLFAGAVWALLTIVIAVIVFASAKHDSRVVRWLIGRDGLQILLGSMVFLAVLAAFMAGRFESPLFSHFCFTFAGFIFGRTVSGSGKAQPPGAGAPPSGH